MTMYKAIANGPTAGAGASFDSREIGPFASRASAELAAIRLADDPRAYSHIRIVEVDVEEEE